jgi:hypothetical protein
MPTMTKPRAPRKPKAPAFACRLVSAVVEINGVQYAVEPIPPGEEGPAAIRLSKLSGQGEVYDLVRRYDGRITCDCPHYTARIEGLSEDLCKHGRALVELGLLPKPKPTMAAPKPEPMDRQTRPATKPEPAGEPDLGPRCGPGCPATVNHPAPCPDCPNRPVTRADIAASAVFGIKLPAEAPADGPGSLQGEPPAGVEETPIDPTPTPPGRPQAAEDPAAGDDPDGGGDLDAPWSEDDRIGLGPEPLEVRSPLADWIDQQAAEYRRRGGTAAKWLARQLDEMASTARVLQAANGEQYDDRLDAMEADRDRRLAEEAVDRFAAEMSSLATA